MADASIAYGQECGNNNFPELSSVQLSASFEQAYDTLGQGSDFTADFSGLLAGIAEIMGTAVPIYDGDDYLSAGILNWPDE